MHMWLWYGYNLGPFLFDGVKVVTKSGLAGACVILFIVGFLFEGSKVYVARMQRNAARQLYPNKRNDERRNLLLAERRAAGPSQAAHVHHNVSIPKRVGITTHQTILYVVHNVVGYLLMLAVMVYNVWLIAAIVLGMMLGYFVFGPMLTKLQTECFANKGPLCTDKCDDNAEGSTPPLLHTSLDSESFVCQTPSCSRRAPAPPPACHYGAQRCPARVAVAVLHGEAAARARDPPKPAPEPGVEDARLLPAPRPDCCAKDATQDPPAQPAPGSCCKAKEPTERQQDVL